MREMGGGKCLMGGFQAGSQQRVPAQLPGVFVKVLPLLCALLGPPREWMALSSSVRPGWGLTCCPGLLKFRIKVKLCLLLGEGLRLRDLADECGGDRVVARTLAGMGCHCEQYGLPTT